MLNGWKRSPAATYAATWSRLDEALADPQFRARGVLERSVVSQDHDALPAISVPIVPALRDPRSALNYPRLGEAQALLDPD